jgi:excisionase family DNA binding protein
LRQIRQYFPPIRGEKGHKVMSMQRPGEQEVLLTPAEVAKMFRVDPKTVTRWAKAGRLTAIRTLGGHRRYRRSEVQALLGIDTKEAKNV